MKKVKVYFVKSLKKLRLLFFFNFRFKRLLNGNSVTIPIINGIGLTNLVFREEWLDCLIKTFIKEIEEKTFVDVGVNIGQTLLRLKSICPQSKYIGFEPNSTCTAYSKKLIEINHFQNCVVQNAALSYKTEFLVLMKSYDVDSRASLVNDLRPDFFTSKEHVLALNFSDFYIDEPIGFVKIDVEGGELEVIKGMESAIRKHRPIITCEVLDSHSQEVFDFTQNRANELYNILTSVEYRVIRFQSTADEKIAHFEQINHFYIKQWTKESSRLNDYLFYPLEKEAYVLSKMKEIIQ